MHTTGIMNNSPQGWSAVSIFHEFQVTVYLDNEKSSMLINVLTLVGQEVNYMSQ